MVNIANRTLIVKAIFNILWIDNIFLVGIVVLFRFCVSVYYPLYGLFSGFYQEGFCHVIQF